MASRTRDSAGFLRAQDWTITAEKPPKMPGQITANRKCTREVRTVGKPPNLIGRWRSQRLILSALTALVLFLPEALSD